MPARSYKLLVETVEPEVKAGGVRHVRTPGGVRHYGEPIGAVITRDVVERAKRRRSGGKLEATPVAPRAGQPVAAGPDDPESAPGETAVNAADVRVGDQIADTDGDPLTVVAARRNRATELYDITTIDALGQRDTSSYSDRIDLARVRAALEPRPIPQDVSTGRPALATYQRRNLAILDLDHDEKLSDDVRQAAARIRLKQPITAEQSFALADHIHGLAIQEPKARQQRSLDRLAVSIGAVDAKLKGDDVPVVRQADKMDKTTVGETTEGDWIALRAPGGDVEAQVGQVTAIRSLMGGRTRELTLTDSEGNVSTRMLTPDTTVYLLPDLPALKPDDGPGKKIERGQLQLGDKISINQGGIPIEGTVTKTEEIHGTDDAGNRIPGTFITMKDDRGLWSSVGVLDDGETDLRLLDRDEGYAARLQAEKAERDRRDLEAGAESELSRVYAFSTVDVMGVLAHYLYRDMGGDADSEYGKPDHLRSVVDSNQEIKDKFETTRRDSAESFAKRFGPGMSDAQRAAMATRIESVIGEVQDRAIDNAVKAISEVEPTKAQNVTHGYARIIFAEEQRDTALGHPNLDSNRQVAKTLVSGLLALRNTDAPEQGVDSVPFDPTLLGDSYTSVVARNKAVLANGFGKERLRVNAFAPTTLAELEAGKVPEIVPVEVVTTTTAADGGPSEQALRHLSAVKEAGRAVRTEVQRRVAEKLPSKEEMQTQIATLVTERDRLLASGQDVPASLSADLLRLRRDSRLGLTPTPQMMSETRKEVMQEVRPLGGKEHSLAARAEDREVEIAALRWAEDFYPKDWLDASATETLTVDRADRGYYSHPSNTIVLSGSDDPGEAYTQTWKKRVALHELGHRMEQMVPGLMQAQRTFLWDRTSIGEVGDRKRTPLTRIYEQDLGFGVEQGFKDDFNDHYTGKIYYPGVGDGQDSSAYEIFTTGIESTYGGSEKRFMLGDLDFQDFMLGVLATL